MYLSDAHTVCYKYVLQNQCETNEQKDRTSLMPTPLACLLSDFTKLRSLPFSGTQQGWQPQGITMNPWSSWTLPRKVASLSSQTASCALGSCARSSVSSGLEEVDALGF